MGRNTRIGGALAGGGVGFGLGAWLGVLDAWLAEARVLGALGEAFAYGPGLDGAVGLVAGAVVGAAVGAPARLGAAGAALGAVAVTLGAVWARPAGAPVGDGGAPDVVWIVTDALAGDAGTDGWPALTAFAEDAVALPAVVPAAADRDVALGSLVWGRYPEGLDGAAPSSLAHQLAWKGLAPVLVRRDDGAPLPAGLADAFDAARVVGVPPPGHPLGGAGPQRLALVRAFWAWPPATPADVAAAAARAVASPGGTFVLVDLGDGGDDALATVLGAVGDDAVVLVSAVVGDPDGWGRAATVAPAWLRRAPAARGAVVRAEPIAAVDLAPTLYAEVGEELFDVGDGVARPLAPVPLPTSSDPCNALYVDVGAPVRGFARGREFVRDDGYVAVFGPDGLALYDDVVDPGWTRDLRAVGAPTCFGTDPTDRVAPLDAARKAVVAASRAGAGRALPERRRYPRTDLFPEPP